MFSLLPESVSSSNLQKSYFVFIKMIMLFRFDSIPFFHQFSNLLFNCTLKYHRSNCMKIAVQCNTNHL